MSCPTQPSYARINATAHSPNSTPLYGTVYLYPNFCIKFEPIKNQLPEAIASLKIQPDDHGIEDSH